MKWGQQPGGGQDLCISFGLPGGGKGGREGAAGQASVWVHPPGADGLEVSAVLLSL